MPTSPTCIEENRNAPNIGTQSRSGYIWLAYSIFLFIEPILRHNTRFWLQTIATYAIFLAAYVTYMNTRTNSRRHLLLGFFYLLGLLTYPSNGGASSFFVYAGAFLPFVIESTPLLAALLAAQCLGVLAEVWFFHLNLFSAVATVFFILVVGVSNAFIARQKRMDARLRAAQQENHQLAAVAERERIARDLHDVLGHTLSVIVLKAELAKRLMQEGPAQNIRRAAQEIADVESTARTALAEVRETIGGYRAQGLTAELAHARQTLDSAGVTLLWQPPPTGAPPLSATEETVLSLSVREAVTNIVRHAEASHCTMRLTPTPEGFHALLVADDGPHPIQQEGNGLRGMRERVTSLGGRLSIRSEQGTQLLIELPITATRQGNPA